MIVQGTNVTHEGGRVIDLGWTLPQKVLPESQENVNTVLVRRLYLLLSIQLSNKQVFFNISIFCPFCSRVLCSFIRQKQKI